MSRIVLTELQSYEFNWVMDVRISDINYGAHVGNSQMIGIVHDARIRMLQELGATEGDLGDGRTALVIADIGANLKSESFLGETLTVESHIDDIGDKGFRVFHRVSSGERLVALVETGIVALDTVKKCVGPLPEQFLGAVNSIQKKEL